MKKSRACRLFIIFFFMFPLFTTIKTASARVLDVTETTPMEYQTYLVEQFSNRKVAYLTFDDGPSKYTDEILNILKKHNIYATFFFIGNNVNKYKSSVLKTYDNGHYIGLHSMTHDFKTLYGEHSAKRYLNEMKEEQKILHSLVPIEPMLIRSPYGTYPNFSNEHRDEVIKEGFKVWDWTVDSLDWRYSQNPNQILRVVFSQIHQKREVILMHERAQTVRVLEEMINELQKRGYEFEVYNPKKHFPQNFYGDVRF